MKKRLWAVLAATALVLPAGAERRREARYKFEERDEVRQTLKVVDPAKPAVVIVDNLYGGIEVQGADVREVELVARKLIKAKSQEKIAEAKKDVELKVSGSGNTVDIYVDGPFRCQVRDCKGFRWRDWGYEVHFGFVLRVPRRTDVTLKTVSGGDIAVRGVEGAFDVSNVNGKVSLEDIAGSGEAGTVNGEVRAAFVKAPASGFDFSTVNGEVDLTFPAGLAADFKFKSMHGEAYSDFDVTPLPPQAVKGESQDGRFLYKRDGFTSVRVGKGGPEISCHTLNGDIYIRKKG
jgi:hypothetical protein